LHSSSQQRQFVGTWTQLTTNSSTRP